MANKNTLTELLFRYVELLRQSKWLDEHGGPHAHCHRVSETWDDDGKPCKICVAWRVLMATASEQS